MRSWRVPTAVTMLAASAFLTLPLAAQTPPDAPSPPAPPQAEKGMNDDSPELEFEAFKKCCGA